ncbi:MAG: hypothetical protein V4692_10480, partial [Bdellovibrionota bacterium]
MKSSISLVKTFLSVALVVVISTVGFSHFAYASESPSIDEANVMNGFEESFFDVGEPSNTMDPVHAYVPLWCPENVSRLIEKLNSMNVALDSAKVLYLVPPSAVDGNGTNIIRPLRARSVGGEAPEAWSFHVVLLLDGKILDLDFTENPTWVDAERYFVEMWNEVPDQALSSEQPLLVREFSAKDYRSRYTGNWNAFVNASPAESGAESKATDASVWLLQSLL